MIRTLSLFAFVIVSSAVALGQQPGVLHISVTLTDQAAAPVPVPRAAFLISDNPATSAPRRVVTGSDGTATVRLRPGNYTVESDEPVAFGGKGFEWRQTLDVAAGSDLVLEFTAANADVGPAPDLSASPTASVDEAATLLPAWQDSVVAVWTPEARASGFLVDPGGLVLTTQRVVGDRDAAEVQFLPSVKVAARVLAADRSRDAAVLWIDPSAAGGVRPVRLICSGAPPAANGQNVIAIGAPLRGPKRASRGKVIQADPHAAVADFDLEPGSAGGPVFDAGGALVGLSSTVDGQDARRRQDARIVTVGDACAVVSAAKKAMQGAQPPAAVRLPVEPQRPFPADALDAVVQRRQGSLNPYEMSSSGFDIAFLTPVLIRGAQQRAIAHGHDVPQAGRVVATDFGDWSDYFADVPPVVAVRVTPKLAEGFWTSIARGAAYTQGLALPPIRHFKPGFSRLRAFCGAVEVTPIHPFTLTQRTPDGDGVREGLYVFDPQAFGPHCPSVKLVIFSEKEPDKPDTRAVDPRIIERLWDDFASYRVPPASPR